MNLEPPAESTGHGYGPGPPEQGCLPIRNFSHSSRGSLFGVKTMPGPPGPDAILNRTEYHDKENQSRRFVRREIRRARGLFAIGKEYHKSYGPGQV